MSFPEAIDSIVEGEAHACALGGSGKVYCWGSNADGQVGIAPVGRSDVPTPVAIRDALALAGRGETFCALDRAHSMWCWGRVAEREGAACDAAPIQYGPFDDPHDLVVGAKGACLLDGGALRCVGLEPRVAALAERRQRGAARALSFNFDLCVFGEKRATCWDAFTVGPRGAYREWRWRIPDRVIAVDDLFTLTADGALESPYSRWRRKRLQLDDDAKRVSVDGDSWCVLHRDGELSCGNVLRDDVRRIAALTAIDVAVGYPRVCAVVANGSVSCWEGDDDPAPVPGVRNAKTVAVGDRSACALLEDGSVVCWGEGDAVLGRGYLARAFEPLVVVRRSEDFTRGFRHHEGRFDFVNASLREIDTPGDDPGE